MGADIVPLVTDEAASERGHSPGSGHAQGAPGDQRDVPASSTPPYWPQANQPAGGDPYGQDQYGLSTQSGVGPAGGDPYGQDQYGLSTQPSSFSAAPLAAPGLQRRIVPSPPPQRGNLLRGLLLGVLAGALVAGVGAFFLGRATAPDRDPGPAAAPQPGMLSELVATNRAKFPSDLLPLAEPWLADMSGCVANTDTGGPELGVGQRSHVLCRDGGMYLHFVAYESAEAKAADLDYRKQLALNSGSILAGADQPGRKLGVATDSPGTYVEYATPAGDAPALCGFWWNRDDTDAAVYVDVLCDSLGGGWDSLRAVWQRHS
ncbi:hypothetical protein [Salinispora oceanensis]|uniref:hypothetical protein n=1 Tax=Salinispora oceanensis TaxID=1050199 RepID=UPI000370DC7B|nr:hypothetical protein [Salinispora oceanensis]